MAAPRVDMARDDQRRRRRLEALPLVRVGGLREVNMISIRGKSKCFGWMFMVYAGALVHTFFLFTMQLLISF
jgi:hypothetical protein